MWPLILGGARVYGRWFTLPIAIVVGTIGYYFEAAVSDKQTPFKKTSIDQERIERRAAEIDMTDSTVVETLKDASFVPKSIFERNLSPSLQITNKIS